MSAALQNSPALKLFGVIAAVITVVVIVVWSTSDDEPVPQNEQRAKTEEVSKVNDEDDASRDQMSEDVKRVAAQLAQMSQENRELKQQLNRISGQQEGNEVDEETLATLVQGMVEKRLAEERIGAGSNNMNVPTSVEEELGDYTVDASRKSAPDDAINFETPKKQETVNLDGFTIGTQSDQTQGEGDYAITEWIKPAGVEESGGLAGFIEKGKEQLDFAAKNDEQRKEERSIQYATIDKEAMLFNALVLTELIGVAPSSDDGVKQPFDFKLEIGRDNLATSGINLPEIASMRMSGYGVGEWVTSCVQGIITSATFVFEDGTITTIGSGNGEKLGYIADPYGSPCIRGEKYSDLMEYAAVAGGLSTVGGFGEGLSRSQYAETTTPQGVVSAFTGNAIDNALGKGLSSGLGTINEVVAERYSNLRDLVIAKPGQIVNVMLSKQINIDYDPEGRKVLNKDFEEELKRYREEQTEAGK